jgi:hypothetical protein
MKIRRLSSLSFVLIATLLGSCTIIRSGVFTKDDCEILAEKRIYNHRGRQPKLKYAATRAENRKPTDNAVKLQQFPERAAPAFYAAADPTMLTPTTRDTGTILSHHDDVLNPAPQVDQQNETDCNAVKPTLASSASDKWTADYSAFGFYALAGLSSIALLSLFRNTSMRLSAWAHRNPRKARVLIGSMQTATIIGAYTTGFVMASEGLKIPAAAGAAAAAVTILAGLAHPRRPIALENYTSDYLKNKYMHVLVFTGAAALLTFVGNSHYSERNKTVALAGYSFSLLETPVAESIDPGKSATTESVAPDPPRKKYLGWRILAIVLFAAATLAVTGAVCALSCEGYTAGAILTGVGLETLLILLLNHVLRSLDGTTKRQRKKREAEAASPGI